MNKKELENIVEIEDKKEVSKYRGIKNYLIDTSAALIFFNPIFALNETYVASMESEEVVKARISMSILNLLAARLYGKYRDFWAKLWKINEKSSKLKKAFCDVSSNLIFYVPLYTTLLAASGASKEEIISAMPMGILTVTILGRPYGWFLDKWRKLYGAKPTLE